MNEFVELTVAEKHIVGGGNNVMLENKTNCHEQCVCLEEGVKIEVKKISELNQRPESVYTAAIIVYSVLGVASVAAAALGCLVGCRVRLRKNSPI